LCPILGPVFPPAKSLSTSSSFKTALASLQSQLQDAFKTGDSAHGPVGINDTYSIQIFSAAKKDLLFEQHHRGTNLAAETPIDGNSVYRVGSVAKMYTVYLLLLQSGDAIFSEPLTRYLPELKGQSFWDEITVGALAGQIGGVIADFTNRTIVYSVDSIAGGGLGAAFPGAFPLLEKNETSPCDANVTSCTRAEALEAWKARGQVYLPNSTPAYSNGAFVLLGFVVEAITGKTYEEAIQSLLIDPLKLRNTTSLVPKSTSGGVILLDETSSGWNIDLTAAAGMGSAFSSTSDLSAIGRSILSSSLLHPNTTRAWLKPTSFTSSLIGAVGRPWEIFRASLDPENNRVVDLYTKGGNIGVYASLLALIPDFNVGFAVQAASLQGANPTV
ncbi:beta-lactamase/transpeptidase-like protein, partial [Dendryphion nanum]